MSALAWIVWRRGYPDPSRVTPALHFEDPARDRDARGRLAVIPVAPEHRSMSLRELLAIDAYGLPASAQAAIEGEIMGVGHG